MMYALFRSTNVCGSRMHNRSIITILYIFLLLITPCVIGETLQENNDKCEHSSFRMLYYKDQLNYAGAIHDIFYYGPNRCSFCGRQISLGAGNPPAEFKSKIYRNIKGKVNIIDIPSAPIVAVCEPQGNVLFIVTVKGLGKIYDNNSFEWIKQFEQKDGLLVQTASFSRSGRYIVMCLLALGLEKDEHNQNIVYAYDIDNMTGEKYYFGTKTPMALIYIDDTAVITTEDKYVYVEQVKNQAVSFRVEERKEDQGIIIGFHKGETICLQKSVSIDEKDQVELISPFFKEGKILFNEDYMYVLSEKENLWLRGSSGKIYKMNKDGLPDLTTTIEKDVVSWGLLDAGGIWINTNDEGIMTLLSDLRLVEENRERTN